MERISVLVLRCFSLFHSRDVTEFNKKSMQEIYIYEEIYLEVSNLLLGGA